MTRILVAYATKHHGTEEIAHAIADVFHRESQLRVHVWPVQEVTSVQPYDVVVMGSAVYMGQWQPEAIEFLENFSDDLAKRPTWLFSSGPTGEGDPQGLLQGWMLPASVKHYTDLIQPRDMAVFHGRLNSAHLNVLERALVKVTNAQVGDYREWDAIRTWAENILNDIAPRPTSVSSRAF